MSIPRVLSIQSHVVFGYVGNKSATFPLQLLGFDVDAINSVQLSNHTGYKTFTGQVLEDKDLNSLFKGLTANKLDNAFTHLLTGYVRNDSFLLSIAKVAKHLKQTNPNLIYVCDPVLGDDGELYVPEKLVAIFRDYIVPLADIITPNQTELGLLAGEKADTLENALKCVKIMHDKGCKIVVVTSMEFADNSEKLYIVASHVAGEKVSIQIPKLKAKFFGTGDLFAALFLAWMTKTNNNISTALESTISTIHATILRTLNSYKGSDDNNFECRGLELKLIQSKEDIENPKILFKCFTI